MQFTHLAVINTDLASTDQLDSGISQLDVTKSMIRLVIAELSNE